MVAGVGEVEIIVAVNGDGSREIELCGGGGAVVPGETSGFNAGDGGDGAGSGVDATDSMIVGVGEEEVAEGVEGEALGSRAWRRWRGRCRRRSLAYRCRR